MKDIVICDELEAITDVLIKAEAVSCDPEYDDCFRSFRTDSLLGILFPARYCVRIDYGKLAQAIYAAGYRKGERRMKMKKVYIDDFCEDLNYEGVVLFIDTDIDLDALLECMKRDKVGHLYRFDGVKDNRLFYIENCDLQNVTIRSNWNELYELIEDDFSILHLKQEINGRYYIHVPACL